MRKIYNYKPSIYKHLISFSGILFDATEFQEIGYHTRENAYDEPNQR
jgi:hypothetical protein